MEINVELFGIAFSGLAILCVSVLCMFVFAGVYFDRHGSYWPVKWVSLAALFGYIWFIAGLPYDFATITGVLFSPAFWKPVGYFLLFGLGYSVVEFLLGNYRIARKVGAMWQSFIGSNVSATAPGETSSSYIKFSELVSKRHRDTVAAYDAKIAEALHLMQQLDANKVEKVETAWSSDISYQRGGGKGHPKMAELSPALLALLLELKVSPDRLVRLGDKAYSDNLADTIKEHLERFVNSIRFYTDYIDFTVLTDRDPPTLEPKINRLRLSQSIFAWIILWPFYAVNLVLGDLLARVGDMLADLFAKFGGRFVKAAFSGIFEIKT
jgi:hypothetical protein